MTLTSLRRSIREADNSFLVGLTMLMVLVVGAIIVPIVSPYSATQSTSIPLQPPSGLHWFGTDNLGRDVFTRAFAAARLDMGLAIAAVSVSLLIGTLVGAIAGMAKRSKLSTVITFFVDGVNAFPFVVLALGIVAVVGPSVPGLLSAIILTSWARYARMARTRTAVIADAEYIQAARLLGYNRRRVMGRHVLPNVYSESFAFALSELVIVVLAIAALSFLGAGIRPPTAEWGAMISEGRIHLRRQWWLSVMPGLMLAYAALAIQVIADGYGRMRRYG
jgi:peptide/nickel transport system permease protein